jgi:hypothetical protein
MEGTTRRKEQIDLAVTGLLMEGTDFPWVDDDGSTIHSGGA